MLDKIIKLKNLLDITPKKQSIEITNPDIYLEKYEKRIKMVLTDSWIDAINEEYNEEEREQNRIGVKQKTEFLFGNIHHKNGVLNKKYDDYILNILYSKKEILEYLNELSNSNTIDDISKKLISSFKELIERLFYVDMFEYNKMNAYRIYDNLFVLKELFKNISLIFLEKSLHIKNVKKIGDEWNHELILMLDEYEDYLENLSYELFDVLESILEYMYIYYNKDKKNNNMEKEKAFFTSLFFQIYMQWVPYLQKIDEKLYNEK